MHSHDCHALSRLSCTQDCPKGKCFNLHSNSRMVKLCLATVLLSLSVPKRKRFNLHSNSRMVKFCLATVLLSLSIQKGKRFNLHCNSRMIKFCIATDKDWKSVGLHSAQLATMSRGRYQARSHLKQSFWYLSHRFAPLLIYWVIAMENTVTRANAFNLLNPAIVVNGRAGE